MIFIIYIILIIYIIYLYLLSGVSKNLPQRTAACMLRPYCYLLFVICYDCARTGLPHRSEHTCVTTLLLFVICYLL